VLGAADQVSVVIRITLVAIMTPDSLRGRVSAVNSLFIGTSNQLGEFESGVAAALLAAPSLRQIHRLTFACTSGRGIVQASVRLFLGVQATLSTI